MTNRARISAAMDILDKAFVARIKLQFGDLCHHIAGVRKDDLSSKIDTLAEDFRHGVEETILAYEKAQEVLKEMQK